MTVCCKFDFGEESSCLVGGMALLSVEGSSLSNYTYP